MSFRVSAKNTGIPRRRMGRVGRGDRSPEITTPEMVTIMAAPTTSRATVMTTATPVTIRAMDTVTARQSTFPVTVTTTTLGRIHLTDKKREAFPVRLWGTTVIRTCSIHPHPRPVGRATLRRSTLAPVAGSRGGRTDHARPSLSSRRPLPMTSSEAVRSVATPATARRFASQVSLPPRWTSSLRSRHRHRRDA